MDLTYLLIIIDSESICLVENVHETKQDILKPYSTFFMNHFSLKKNKSLIYLVINFQLIYNLNIWQGKVENFDFLLLKLTKDANLCLS